MLASWFIAISTLRLAVLQHTLVGFDGRLYRSATMAWLAGGDPWKVSFQGVYYAAPPPSLLPFVPLTWLPEDVAIAILIGLCVVASVILLRRVGLPLWWLAFPPLVDGIWNANVHVLVAPLLLLGLAPLAGVLKVYALAVPTIHGEWKSIALSGLVLVATIPILPWGTFLNELPAIVSQLSTQSRGGLSVTGFPPPAAAALAVLAGAAIFIVGRERGAWFAVPVLWPSTQWYYSSTAIPGASSLAALVLAVPIGGGAFLALMVLAVETVVRRRSAMSRSSEPAG